MNFIVIYYPSLPNSETLARHVAIWRGYLPYFVAEQIADFNLDKRVYTSRESMARDVEEFLAGGNLDG